jgi:uncharacterized protein YndB with AHSA1/START domain
MSDEWQQRAGAVRARIAAPAEELWAIVANPRHHPELAGSGEPQETWLVGEGPLGVGSRFESRQKAMGFRYTSHSTVTACEPPRLLRWSTDGPVEWEFRFDPSDGTTLVTHTFRWNRSPNPALRLALGPLMRWRGRQMIRGMAKTLANLARMAGAPAPTDLQTSDNPPPADRAW